MQPFNIKTNTLNIQGLKAGFGDDIVIALHGWLDNCHSFLPMLNNIPAQQTWYCFDFPGHGLSSWRAKDAHYYFVDYINDVYQVIKALNVNKVHLVGHSMGAMVAGLFASCFGEHVKTVTFIEGIGCITTPSDDVAKQLKSAVLNQERLTNKKQRIYKSKTLIYDARAKTTDLDYADITLLMERNIQSTTDGFVLTTDPKLKNHSGFRFDEMQCIGAIKQLNAPCQLILGNNGYLSVKQNLDKYNSYYKDLKVLSVSGGHHCHMQDSEQCFEYINTFMNQYGAC